MIHIHRNRAALVLIISVVLGACGHPRQTEMTAAVESQTHEVSSPQSIVEKLKEFAHRPVAERVALYHRLKEERPDAYDFENEDELNMYGYSLLWNQLPEEALAIFKLCVEQFPTSSNTYDSLGEGYLAVGDREQSLVNYQKSLALNPDNFNAEDQIERIQNPGVKQKTFADKFPTVLSIQDYRDDLDQLGEKLMEVHPNVFKFISREDLQKVVEEKKAQIDEHTTYGAFYWHCLEVIASVNCSHTYSGQFFGEADFPVSMRFPIQTRWVGEQLFVTDPAGNGDRVHVKDEVVSINGVPVATIIREIYKHISSQGYIETTKNHVFNTWSTALIAYALHFPEAYDIMVAGKEKPIRLKPAERALIQFGNPAIKFCPENLCLEVSEKDNTAVLTIASFNYYPWGNLSEFQTFIDRSFSEIRAKGVENLIIDVRFNGGGSAESSIYLLRHLVGKPFTYTSYVNFPGKVEKSEIEEVHMPVTGNGFDGTLYFLIDGNGNSTTGHFMSLAKVLDLGTIIGEELGSNQFCSAGQRILRLPNTRLEYYVANNTHISSATSLPDERGILPDHTVVQSIDDYLNKRDTVMEYALGLIQKRPANTTK